MRADNITDALPVNNSGGLIFITGGTCLADSHEVYDVSMLSEPLDFPVASVTATSTVRETRHDAVACLTLVVVDYPEGKSQVLDTLAT